MKNSENRQHGFKSKHSTITQILQYCGKFFRRLNAKESALSIYLDIAKAFDTINHNAILLKPMHFGFDNQFLKFLLIIYQIELSAFMLKMSIRQS